MNYLTKEEIADMIKEWRRTDKTIPLHKYLGWTEKELDTYNKKKELPK